MAKAEKASYAEAEKEVEAKSGKLVLKFHVKHNGKLYEKGSEPPAEHKELFKNSDFLVEI